MYNISENIVCTIILFTGCRHTISTDSKVRLRLSRRLDVAAWRRESEQKSPPLTRSSDKKTTRTSRISGHAFSLLALSARCTKYNPHSYFLINNWKFVKYRTEYSFRHNREISNRSISRGARKLRTPRFSLCSVFVQFSSRFSCHNNNDIPYSSCDCK